MTKYSRNIMTFLTATILITSCSTKKTVILSKFADGKPQETIELNLPVSRDSLGFKKLYFENGNLKAFGESKNGKREGEWICYFPDGKPEWKAFFKDDIENGEVTCYKENGEWRKENLTNGIRNGKTVFYFYDYFDSTYCYAYGTYVNGLKQGLWTKRDTSGTLLIEMTYVDGDAIGYFTNRYKNGKFG